MRQTLRQYGSLCTCVALVALAAGPIGQTRAQEAGTACDRACLSGFLDDYLAALAARDPSRLPVAADVIYTENGRAITLGEGIWRSAGSPVAYRDDLLDPVTGGAAMLTAVREADGIAQLFVRLAVAERRITEIETIVVRAGDVRWFAAENLESLSDLFSRPVAQDERHTREELVAGARAYFTAVETEGTPAFVQAPFAPGMNRIENGLQTTNVEHDPLTERHRWSADLQLERAAYEGTVITDRRYPVIDTDNGTVLAIAVFRFAGPNGPTLLLAEIFRMTGGQLQEIRAIVRNLPADGESGWPAPTAVPRYAVNRARVPITIDGRLSDAEWSAAAPAVTLQFLWPSQTGMQQRTFAQLLWDAEALYVGYRADDTDINARFTERDDPTFLDDAVEIFINPAPDQETLYYGFEMNARGVLYDYLNYESRTLFKRYDATDVEVGVMLDGTLNDRRDVDNGWTVEIAIPWENFERLSRRPPEPGDVWAANLNRWDGVEPDRRMSIWSDPMNDESWPHVPSRFGELAFVD